MSCAFCSRCLGPVILHVPLSRPHQNAGLVARSFLARLALFEAVPSIRDVVTAFCPVSPSLPRCNASRSPHESWFSHPDC